jgi:hypothetical protein
MIHPHRSAFPWMNASEEEGVVLRGRRNLLKAGLAGLAGLTVPDLLRARAATAAPRASAGKSVILLWMTGGPSQLDTWDPKPDRPVENRGPFGTIPTRLPGVRICEHLPKMAGMLDRFTLIRSVDSAGSNHEPNTVFQTGNRLAESRTNPEARKYPAIGSICAKFRGANRPGMPPYVAFKRSDSHLAFGGYLGKEYDPFIGNGAVRLPLYNEVGVDSGRLTGADALTPLPGLSAQRVLRRRALREDVDRLRRLVDADENVAAADVYEQQAVEMLLGGRTREAFDRSISPASRSESGSGTDRTSGISRRCSRAGWSRQASPSSPST